MIYADAAATTPVKQQVLDAIVPLLTADYGNPSSTHDLGKRAAQALASARRSIADDLGVRPGDVVFTSGGTESNNLAIVGLALANPRGKHVVHSAIEHPSVVEACAYLGRHHGFTVEVAPVDEDGIIDVETFAGLLRDDSTLVSVMAVNNEIGTVQPIDEISALARSAGALIHVDAVQAAGWIAVADIARNVDAVSLSGHKIGGIKGAGVLMVRGKLALEPVLHGGGQERARRSGTENVAGAVSTAVALRLATEAVGSAAHVSGQTAEPGVDAHAGLYDPRSFGSRLSQTVLAGLNTGARIRARLTGHRTSRVPGIVSFVFPGTSGETVLLELERLGVICSSGSACAAGSTDPSHVLLAIGISEEEAHTAVRLSFSRETSLETIDEIAQSVIKAVTTIVGD